MGQLDAPLLAARLVALYGLPMEGRTEIYEGGVFAMVRPLHPPTPNAFAIQVARTPSRVEATFRLDRYARGLHEDMASADEQRRRMFALLSRDAVGRGVRVNAIVDGEALDPPYDLPVDGWDEFELDCDLRTGNRQMDLMEALVTVASACLGIALSLMPVEELPAPDQENTGLPEGAGTRVEVNRYERSAVNRAACLSHFGFSCQACGMDFTQVYGELGTGFIEVHHRVPVSAMGGAYRIDPVRDLVPVCSNCHSMLHRRNPPLDVATLRSYLGQSAREA